MELRFAALVKISCSAHRYAKREGVAECVDEVDDRGLHAIQFLATPGKSPRNLRQKSVFYCGDC